VSEGARWQLVKAIFDAAVLLEGEERAAFVRARCAGDTALQAAVESLLAADRDRGNLLDAPALAGVGTSALAAVAQGSARQALQLEPGTRLGSYTISTLLGAGGMGEVYRARDTALGREVAIKILPAHWMSDPERRRRFEREARVLAALNHPNVGAIYGLAESGDVRGLVLELVAGETLASRIERARRSSVGPVGLRTREALDIALQIGAALEAAHERGIVHRDLKPANVTLAPDGRVKVLDFGVAAVAGDVAIDTPLDTTGMAEGATRAGALLGTAAYMSPEQARGELVDRRTDIWAFGCVLYEMLTGDRAFAGADANETRTRVLQEEPDLSRVAPDVPDAVRRLLSLCLEKDRAKRLAHVAIARFQIETLLAGLDRPATDAPGPAGTRRFGTAALAAASMAGAFAGFAVAWLGMPRLEPVPAALHHLLLDVSPADEIGGTAGRPPRTAIALSPDGLSLVFSAIEADRRALYVRRLDRPGAERVAGTDGAEGPFFSPDGQWIGYVSGGEIRRVPLAGGPSVRVTDVGVSYGASWGDDGRIVYSSGGELWEVPAGGGEPAALTAVNKRRGEVSHRTPHVLPGSDVVLYTISSSRFPRWDRTTVAAYSRRTGSSIPLIDGGADARWSPTGHLVFVREGLLLAVPFDAVRLQLGGEAVGLIDGVMQAAYFRTQRDDTGAAQFTFSSTGTLVYATGGTSPPDVRSIVQIDRAGTLETFPVEPRPFVTLRLSPDGERVALSTFGRDRDIWVYAPARGTFSRLAVPGRPTVPIWTPDGEHLTFATGIAGPDGLHRVRADGAGPTEPIFDTEHDLVPATWTADARQLLHYRVSSPPTAIWGYDVGARAVPTPIVQVAAGSSVGGADLSPDGRWLAYHAEESGRFEVYVQAYPGGAPRVQVSSDGGFSPVWRSDGRELFYMRESPGADPARPVIGIMAVPIAAEPRVSVGTATELFAGRFEVNRPARAYDVSADGRQVVLLQPVDRPPDRLTHLHVVQHWFEELKRRSRRTRSDLTR
jgi:eukaryotic-like serine/threonine-protein kinase